MTDQPLTPAPIDWETWIAEHRKTCALCRASFEEMDGGICEEAFDTLQRYMRQQQDEGRP